VRLTRVGGTLAVAVSSLLLVVVLVRDVGVNPLNGWTIFMGAAGGIIAAASPTRTRIPCAWLMVFLAALPALVGGFGLLYVPSLVLLPIGRRVVAPAKGYGGVRRWAS